MGDDEFINAVSKLTDKKENASLRRLKKEASKNAALTAEDRQFKALIERDSDEAKLAAGEELIRDEKRIVGKAPRGSIDKEIYG